MGKIFHVYLDWTLEDVPRCFYVGKGDDARVKKRERNTYWKNVAAKFGWRREKIISTKEETYAYEQEVEWVARMGTFEGAGKECWGYNLTIGGDGPTGYCHSNEARKKIGDATRGENNPMYGKSPSLASREKNRVAHVNQIPWNKGISPTASQIEKNKHASSGENNAWFGVKGADHPAYGNFHSNEWKTQMSSRMSGDGSPTAKLTRESVREIRKRYESKADTQTSLAKEFGVRQGTISNIVNRKIWKGV